MGNCPRGGGGAVAQGESFRGNCLGCKIPEGNCPGRISLGGGGGKSPGGISWEAVVREGSCPKGN